MPIRRDLDKERVEKDINKHYDNIESIVTNIQKNVDDPETSYYIAAINLMGKTIPLFGKDIPSNKPSEEIEVSKDKYYELKNKKFFNNEIKREEAKEFVNVQYIKNELDLLNHKKIIELLSSTQSSKVSQYPTSYLTNIKFDRTPSKYQKEFFEYVAMLANDDPRVEEKNVVAEAFAGSGKTWAIENATKLIPPNKTACYLAFNTSVVGDFKVRAPLNIKDNVMTLNSAGNKIVLYALRTRGYGKQLDKVKGVDPDNVGLILDNLFKNKYKQFTIDDIDNLKNPVDKLVAMYKATGLEINYNNTNDLMDKYNISYENVELSDIMMLCKDVMTINADILKNKWNKIDFNDQLWLPIELDLSTKEPGLQFDIVFADEVQDFSMTKIELAIKMCKPGGSIIAVGDRYQSIYGFTGADVDAIPKIIARLNAKVFPLPICYRCPKSHLRIAQRFVPEIQWATMENSGYEAIEGSVENKSLEFLIDNATKGDKVVCRNSAPLVHPCFELIRRGKKATILGSNIGDGLKSLMKRVGGRDLKDFSNRLDRWKEKQVERLESKKQSTDKVIDQYETLQVLMEDCDTIEEILYKIKEIFTENKDDDIILSTVHKAKGSEVKTKDNSIYVIMSYNGRQLMPNSYAKKDWELQQEENIQYVAFTRGKNKMYLIDDIKSIGV